MPPDIPEILRLVALIAAAALAHAALQRLARRLPVWLARRGVPAGRPAPTPPAHWRRRAELALLAPKTALWAAVAWTLSERLPQLQMSRAAAGMLLSRSLTEPLFTWNGRGYSALDLVTLPALLGGAWLAVSAAVGLLRRQMARFSGGRRGVHESIATLAKLVLGFLASIVIFQAWGLDVSSLTFLASVLGVGIGFGLQNLANNFVSGIVIGLERPLQTGDYVSVGTLQGTVKRIGGRCTVIETADRTTILVPNALLLEREVVNWSLGDPVVRIAVPVGVAYGSDVPRVREALLEAVRDHRRVLPDPRPSVQLLGFGENALEFRVLVWTREPRGQQQLRSDLYFRIEASLRRHGIEVAFADRDLRLGDPELREALRRWLEGRAEAETGRPRAAGAGVPHPAADTAPEVVRPSAAHGPFDEASPWTDADVVAAAQRMRGPGGVEVRDRRHHFTTYRSCFLGSDATAWLATQERLSRAEAREIGQRMIALGLLHHVLDEHGFQDGPFFYRFRADEAAGRARRGDHAPQPASKRAKAAMAAGGEAS